ncbi:MAG: DUF2304 domain-containing protein [Faecalibacterium sp.]
MIVSYQIFLFIGAACTLIYFLRQISRRHLNIESAVFWSIFSGVFVVLSIFPQIMIRGAQLLEIESPANLLFLIVLCLLIFYQFFATVKLSKLEQQITALTQYIALQELGKQEQAEETVKNNEK